MRRLSFIAAIWCVAAGAVAATPAGDASATTEAARDAIAAAEQLRSAMGMLDQALTADDQVVALTQMIRAYETGLGALRDGLRRAGVREQEIRQSYELHRDRLSRTLGAMTVMERSPETLLLLHPDGPEATARAGMIMAAVTPTLRAEADRLRASLEEIAVIRSLEQASAQTLSEGLIQVQEARRLLASAVTDRSSLPVRFLEDPKEVQQLLSSADTLDAFATGLASLENDVGAPTGDFVSAKGALSMPVTGTVLRKYREPDAAGVRRPGLVIATQPRALVTTPWPATIRYRGPLLDYGNVMIIEPAKGYLLIFAGMAQVFGATGDVLAAGEPLGLMGGTEGKAEEFGSRFVADAAAGGAAGQSETLYVELRRDKETLDPSEWFTQAPTPVATKQN
ncbi:murein hydrolase activator EnvC family protein [Paracoccus pacificus]|uniref:Murein hydrolase activator EnvC family protein n=1 Tax=Paracoccus pacificus TaxID=1463598 RepID=A0ABW4R1Q3_9RHOB